AILEALNKWAITAHYMDAGIDTGEIIEKFEFSIDPDEETALSLERKSQEFMLSLYKKTVRDVLNKGRLKSSPNNGGRYISRKEMEQLKKILPGDDINRKIRAFWFPPYVGAFIEIEGKKYTLVNQQVLMSLANLSETYLMSPERR
ncbi:MAG: formyl transferase, partial [Bacteroidota bacterium]